MPHFIWVMRDKGSEWRAVKALSESGRLAAAILVEAVCEPIIGQFNKPGKSPSAVIEKLVVQVSQLARRGRVWVDLHNLGMALSPRDVLRTLQTARHLFGASQHLVTPVLRTSAAADVIAETIEWVRAGGCGICIRIDGVTHLRAKGDIVSALISDAGLDASQIDLIVDAQDLPRAAGHSELRSVFPIAHDARTFGIVAGTFPAAITKLDPNVYEHKLERGEWLAWKEEVDRGGNERIPLYGDFATQPARYSPSPGFPGSPSVRYSGDSEFIVLRGRRGRIEDGIDYSQYIGHARFLRRQPYYRSPIGTIGDDYVERIAAEDGGTGNAPTWRTASLNRHVELAAHQVAMYAPVLERSVAARR